MNALISEVKFSSSPAGVVSGMPISYKTHHGKFKCDLNLNFRAGGEELYVHLVSTATKIRRICEMYFKEKILCKYILYHVSVCFFNQFSSL